MSGAGTGRPGWAAGAMLVAGGAGAVVLALVPRLLPLPADDSFRGTLALLPLVVGGFAAIHGWVRERGGGAVPRAAVAGEAIALAMLLLAIAARLRLDLPRADEVLAAGLALLLAHRVARQLAAARPLLGDRLPRRPSVAFFLLPLLVYLAILPWSARHRQPDGDEPFYLLITHSLAYDLDADLTNNYAAGDWRFFMDRPIAPQPGDPVGPRGELYSRHNELLPIALAPAYRLAGKRGALAMMAAITALLAWMTLRIARHYVPDRPGEALAAYALVAFAPPLLLYSYQVWVEVPATLLALLALDRILALDGRRGWGLREWLGIGLPVLALPLVKIRFMLLAAPLLALGWWRAGRPKKPLLILAVLLGAVGGGILLHNQLVYSNPLKIHTWQELELHHYAALDYLAGALGLFWDAAFGLFACAPVWLALLAGLPLLAPGFAARHVASGAVDGRHRLLLFDLAVLTLPYLLIVAPRSEWYGGWSPPFRYALVTLPLLGLALVPVLVARHRPGARALLAGLGALTLVLTLLWLVVPGWTYNFAHGRTYLLDHLSERLGADVARLFPSSVRPRPATWIWPAATLLAVPLLWWLPAGRWGPARASHGLARRRRSGAPGYDLSLQPDAGTPEGRDPEAPEGEDRERSGPGAAERHALLGVAVLLLLMAVVPLTARRLPTRVVELEDPQVVKSGGHLHPDLWVIERTRFHGGWVLRVAERLEAPVVPGGDRVRIVLRAEFIRNQPVPFTLELRAGGALLATWRPEAARVWQEVELGTFDWPAGAPLVLEAHGPHPPGALNGAILDRIELDWL